MVRRSLPPLLLLLLATPALARVTGVVTSSQGAPVEHAVVTAEGGAPALTDSRGRFVLEAAEAPVILVVEHPRFLRAEVTVGVAEVTIELAPKQEIFERIVVSAERGGDRIGPVSVAADTVDPAASPLPPSTLMEAVKAVPGVAENGQGGLFQVYSVRGVSRQRVQTLFAGVPIVGERRAGVSASFLDPLLMGGVEVVRGPSSTYYGSGALGGVIQVFPRRFETPWADVGWKSAGDERHLVTGWGDGTWSVGIAHRQADDDEAADGTPLHSRFRQTSAAVSREWEIGERRLTLSLVPSYGADIGKVNASFPETVTLYPRERHLLGSLRLEGREGWSLTVFAHPNDLVTLDLEPQQTAEVGHEALDFGASGQGEWSLGPDWTLQAGVDYFARRGVTADETRRAPDGSVRERFRTLDGARLDEAGGFVSTRWGMGRATLSAGGRATWQRQENTGLPAEDDTAGNAFVGAVVPVGGSWELTGNAGTGLRFPSLSERFFVGTTGRGEVVGNPDLDPERSLNVDVGARRYGSRTYVATYLFRNQIDDYIERIRRPDGRRTFVNLTSGTIEGVEVEGFWEVRPSLRLALSGHRIEGESDEGETLADVPADRVELSATWSRGAWTVYGAWQHRARKGDAGPGEQPIPSADLVSMAASFRMTSGLQIRLAGNNLLDETYFNAADDALPPMPGASLELGLRWAP